ncbi:hypothetical protein [Vibrio mediterranei]|uniref:Uncharacterized protein n=1 Tax=Vibrio mediterranei TaxID=689 RepID=A0ABX5D778_9VIBR|nr:hypothetical protein [Vibrio mediterranei]MCG9658856.1 hypothetical protein [Vibrio mediterranei]PRQ65118.1 hypothetical protein COR51_23645 [Vibrio mediterranei]
MGKPKDVPNSTSLRFSSESRVKGIQGSLRRLNDDNLSQWLREAIDLRLYMEGKGLEIEQILSGDFFKDLELRLARHSEREKDNHTYPPVMSSGQVEELSKMLIRMHGILKYQMKMLMENPNVNMTGKEYPDVFSFISNNADSFYREAFNKDN